MEAAWPLCGLPQTRKASRKDTGVTHPTRLTKEKNMTNARIDRMLRELNSEPPVQFFQELFGLVGLGEPKPRLQPVVARVAPSAA